MKTLETASDGYRRALAAHQEVAPPRRVDSAIAEAVERRTAAMRALSRRVFPEPALDGGSASIEASRAEQGRRADASHAAALRRARAERTPAGEAA